RSDVLRRIKVPAPSGFRYSQDRRCLLTDLPSLIANEQGPSALMARGAWTVAHVERLERLCAGVSAQRKGAIDLSGVTALDTVGAWVFEKLARSSVAGSPEAIFVGASPSYSGLLREVRELNRQDRGSERRENPLVNRMTEMARHFVADGAAFLHMLGAISFSLG